MAKNILKELEEKINNNPESSYHYKIEKEVVNISGILKEIRLSKNISQIEIARKTGISKQMVSKIESVNGNPTLTVLVKYCDCIGVDLSKLLKQFLLNNTDRKE